MVIFPKLLPTPISVNVSRKFIIRIDLTMHERVKSEVADRRLKGKRAEEKRGARVSSLEKSQLTLL